MVVPGRETVEYRVHGNSWMQCTYVDDHLLKHQQHLLINNCSLWYWTVVVVLALLPHEIIVHLARHQIQITRQSIFISRESYRVNEICKYMNSTYFRSYHRYFRKEFTWAGLDKLERRRLESVVHRSNCSGHSASPSSTTTWVHILWRFPLAISLYLQISAGGPMSVSVRVDIDKLVYSPSKHPHNNNTTPLNRYLFISLKRGRRMRLLLISVGNDCLFVDHLIV